MKIALLGIGKMGKLIEKIALHEGHTICAKISSAGGDIEKIERADVCIDFSLPHVVIENLKMAAKYKKNIVIGTTGWYTQMDNAKKIAADGDIGVVYSPNFSLGVQLFFQILEHTCKLMAPFKEYDTAISETHHSHKLDSPSGTAKTMAQIVQEHTCQKCPVSSLRVGSHPGAHTVFFDSPGDQITITHDARSRDGFAKGALQAARWIHGKKGFYNFSETLRAPT
jgi:4-hydroxy-tetrahydrodipicolinate reductase